MKFSEIRLFPVLEVIDHIKSIQPDITRKTVKTVNHIMTKTTQNTIKLSEEKNEELQKIIKKITREMENKVRFAEIKEKYKHKVGTIIATAVREAFLIGFHYIEEVEGRSLELSENLIHNLNEMIKSAINDFWLTLELVYTAQQNKEAGIVVSIDAEGILATLVSIASRTIATLTTWALNEGTIQTARQTVQEQITVTGTVNSVQIMFVSERDGKVCPTCLNFDGRVYDYDDPLLPRIPDDTHFNCRCRYLAYNKGTVFNG